MNKKQIILNLQKVYTEFLKSIDDKQIRHYILNNTFITGGAITSMLLNEDVSDYDVYFNNIHACKEVLRYYLKKLNLVEDSDYHFQNKINISDDNEKEFEDRVKVYIPHKGFVKNNYYNNPYYPIFVSTNAMTLTNNIQLVFRFIGEPEKIHENYDFNHTKCYYVPRYNKLILPYEAVESILTKELIYNGSKYPLASIIRTRKFIQRGWNVNAGQYLKMVLQLQELDLDNPIILSDQLTGVDLALFEMVIDEIKKYKEINQSINTEELVEIIDRVFENEGIKIDFMDIVEDRDNDNNTKEADKNTDIF